MKKLRHVATHSMGNFAFFSIIGAILFLPFGIIIELLKGYSK